MFITIEGLDCAGKGTMARCLVDNLISQGVDVIHTREPGGSPGGELIRSHLLSTGHEYPPTAIMAMMFAGRFDHVDKLIRPALAQKTVVVCERFIDTTYAYQVAGQGANEEVFHQLEKAVDLVPDQTFYLDVTPATAINRLRSRHGDNTVSRDNFERQLLEYEDFWVRIERGFRQRLTDHPDRITVLDAEQPLIDFQSDIKQWGGKIADQALANQDMVPRTWEWIKNVLALLRMPSK